MARECFSFNHDPASARINVIAMSIVHSDALDFVVAGKEVVPLDVCESASDFHIAAAVPDFHGKKVVGNIVGVRAGDAVPRGMSQRNETVFRSEQF